MCLCLQWQKASNTIFFVGPIIVIIVIGYTVKTVLVAFVLAKQGHFCCELSWFVVEAGMNIPMNILMNTAPEKNTLCAFLI